jgi:hypothetical protein
MTEKKLVTIYPTGDAYIAGVAAVEQEVSEAEAKKLLAYTPPAFTTDPPKGHQKPEGPAPAGPLDSPKE